MKSFPTLFGIGMLVLPAAFASSAGVPTVIDAAQFARKDVVVVGALGVPLGTAVEIEGVIVAAADAVQDKTSDLPPEKRWQGNKNFLLSVEKVNGRTLSQPKLLKFKAPFGGAASHYSELGRIFPKPDSTPLSETEERAAALKYIGARVTLTVHETGDFGGAPRNLPADIVPAQSTRAFGYEPQLFVWDKMPGVELEKIFPAGVPPLATPEPR